MRKMMSVEQVEANRANAGKSTGPKTEEGKANSRRNALKRGILAREVVLQESSREQASEFQALYRQFWAHLDPLGPVEEALVERMVTSRWRLRRVLIVERGEISRRQIGAEQRLGGLDGSEVILAKEMKALEQAHDNVESDGELTEAVLEGVMQVLGSEQNRVTDGLRRVWEDSLRSAEGLLSTEESPGPGPQDEEAALKVGRRERLLTFIERELEMRRYALAELKEREAQETQARRDASFLPSATALDGIWRYETMLERQFYRAMNQLERLQRARRGEVVPPPLTMEVSGG